MVAHRRLTWNPRYACYARAHGRSPAAMLDHDKRAWPGGRMCGFIVWLSARWVDWERAHGYRRGDAINRANRAAEFDAWLSAHAAAIATPVTVLRHPSYANPRA